MSQRLGVVLHKNPPRLRWIYDLNWFRDRDCTHTHTHIFSLFEQYSYAMEENRARRRLIQLLDKGAESAENGGTLPDPSSAFKFISRISFHGLRGGCSAAA